MERWTNGRETGWPGPGRGNGTAHHRYRSFINVGWSTLARTIARLKEDDPGSPAGATTRQDPERPATERFFLRGGDRCWFVNVHDIQLFSTEGKYTRVYFGDQEPLVLRFLNKLEERFAGSTQAR